MNIVAAEKKLNVLVVLGVCVVLLIALVCQVMLHELPCPLCLLQRIGFCGIILGLMLNLRFGLRPSHYAITLFSALFTGAVALRQISLHIIPGTGAYGAPIMGLHLYSWSFILSAIILVVATVMLSIDKQYQMEAKFVIHSNVLLHVLFAVMILLLLANIGFTYLECGFYPCELPAAGQV